MDLVGIRQIVIVAVFLAMLLAVWFVIQRNRTALSARLRGSRRLTLGEVLSLGGDARLTLVRLDGRDFLVATSRRGAPSIVSVDRDTQAAPPAAGADA